MPVESKIDPFKPAQPVIPGVDPHGPTAEEKGSAEPAVAAERAPSPIQTKPIAVAMAGATVLVIVLGGIVYARHMSRTVTTTSSAGIEVPARQTQLEKPMAAKVLATGPVGPGPVATTDELTRPWSSKKFMFPDSVTAQLQPALVVRLPGGSFWAFSLREPFGACELELVTDLNRLRTEYNFAADHPMVGDTCNRSVYDLLQYGGGAEGGLVRGDIVHGSGIRPPMAIEIRLNGKELVAARAE